MDAPADPKLVPAVVLLNELDNLLAQLRSMELDVKRAQAEADAKIAALHHQVAQLEAVRVAHEEENASLRHRAETQERALNERREAVTAVEVALHSKIQSLQQDLSRSRRDLEERALGIEEARANTDAERQGLDRLLRAREDELRAAQGETQRRLGAKIHELELQLADKQLLAESRAAEIVNLKTQLAQRPTELGSVASEPNFGVMSTGQGKAPAPSNKTELDEQEKAMKMNDVNKPLAQSATESEESGAPRSSMEQSLREEIERLRREARERNQILQDRNDELVRVKSELDRLKERVSEIESASTRAESAYSGEAAQLRNEFQARLALLQAELSQKEWALEEQQAEARGREQNLRQEIELLRGQSTAGESQKAQPAHDFVFGEPRSNLAHEPRFEMTGKAEAADASGNGFSGHRRWNSGFGWKRRWRA
jgi:chromosome segregation ATPase